MERSKSSFINRERAFRGSVLRNLATMREHKLEKTAEQALEQIAEQTMFINSKTEKSPEMSPQIGAEMFYKYGP